MTGTKEYALRYLSLGAGRQSTAVYLLCVYARVMDVIHPDEAASLLQNHQQVRRLFAAFARLDEKSKAIVRGWKGQVPSVAIFADTQDEPQDVYAHLDRLQDAFGRVVPINRVSKGKLSEGVYRSKEGKPFAAPPLYVRVPESTRELPVFVGGEEAGVIRVGVGEREGMLRRQCTKEFKIEPIEKEVRRLLGMKKGQRVPRDTRVESWQGISIDEASRMKTSRTPWVENRYPLAMELEWSAKRCEAFNLDCGFQAAKSACVYCPFTDDLRWRHMKAHQPADFAAAVAFDRRLREGENLRGVAMESFVHRSFLPLDEVDFRTPEEMGQTSLFGEGLDGDGFGNECEGLCGV